MPSSDNVAQARCARPASSCARQERVWRPSRWSSNSRTCRAGRGSKACPPTCLCPADSDRHWWRCCRWTRDTSNRRVSKAKLSPDPCVLWIHEYTPAEATPADRLQPIRNARYACSLSLSLSIGCLLVFHSNTCLPLGKNVSRWCHGDIVQ